MKISAPCHLEAHHYLDSFCCGESLLDTWLKTRARMMRRVKTPLGSAL